MELTKELKEKLEKAKNKEEAKKIIEDAGMELTDEEIDQVAGGRYYDFPKWNQRGGNDIQLTGELKEKVEQTESKEEAKKTIEAAGMILDDAELDQVVGGKAESERKPVVNRLIDFAPTIDSPGAWSPGIYTQKFSLVISFPAR